MNIFVLVKQVPDTEASIKVKGNNIDETVKWIPSPFDDQAVQGALDLKKATGATVTAVSLGPDRSVDALRNAFAMGVDEIVHIKDNEHSPLDVSYNGYVLGKYLATRKPDIVITGYIAIDSQSSGVPAMVAGILGCNVIQNAVKIDVEGETVKVKREIEGGTAVVSSPLPVVISAARGLNEPRYPALKGVMAAKKKVPEVVDVATFSSGVPSVEILSLELPPSRPPSRILEGELDGRLEELISLLKNEIKVI